MAYSKGLSLTSDMQVTLRGCGASCWSWYTITTKHHKHFRRRVCIINTERYVYYGKQYVISKCIFLYYIWLLFLARCSENFICCSLQIQWFTFLVELCLPVKCYCKRYSIYFYITLSYVTVLKSTLTVGFPHRRSVLIIIWEK